MNRVRLLISASICVVIIGVVFALSVPRATEVQGPRDEARMPSAPTITFTDSVKKGFHTISGTVLATTACATLDAAAAHASTSEIRVDLSFSQEPGVCLERATPFPFQTTVLAPDAERLSVYLNGALASSTAL